MLEAIIALINKLIPSGNFLIGGMSYGGLLARGVILRMPERVDGALLWSRSRSPKGRSAMLPHKIALVKDEELLGIPDKKGKKRIRADDHRAE